jgi:hypothetical protein
MGIAPLNNPVAAAFAIRVKTDLAHAVIAQGRIVEALAAVQTGDAGRMGGVLQIGGGGGGFGGRDIATLAPRGACAALDPD